jgi:hypothetical protein
MRPALLPLLLISLVATSCEGSSDPKDLTDEAARVLGSGDYSGGLVAYEKALEVIGNDTSHPQYFTAAFGCIEAGTLDHPARAVRDLEALHGALPGTIRVAEYGRITDLLVDHAHLDQADTVLSLGLETFPDDPGLARRGQRIEDERAKPDAPIEDPEAAKALEAFGGLGYVNGGGD